MSSEQGVIARRFYMCRNKKRYGTYSAAERGAKGCHRNTGDIVHAYPCAVCGGYHVGSVEPRDEGAPRVSQQFKRERARAVESEAFEDDYGYRIR